MLTYFTKMWILQVTALLLTISTLQASTQASTCPDVQQKLQALLEAVQVLCGSSTPPPTTTQPAPVVQQCDCSPEVTWTSVTITRIAFTQLRHTGTLAYDIPSVIPNTAREVLVLVSVTVGNSGPDHRTHQLKIYTEQDQRQYEKYVFFISRSQNAWNTNSENMWFPVTSGRQIFVNSAYAHTGAVEVTLHAIGYR